MARKILTMEDAKKAVYGGCILGGGGGGWIDDGLEKARQAFQLGKPELITVDELEETDYVACVSLVGAPSANELYVDTEQIIGTVKRMQTEFQKPLKALMTNENGAATSINGWLQAAATGLPFLDAPSNGRAHPTGSMGSLNLSDVEGYTSIQAFAGGKGTKKMEGVVASTLDLASSAIRSISVQAGGMVAVCRNPVEIGYVKKHAAVGGITQAIELGEVFLQAEAGYDRIEKVAEHLNGQIIHSGVVSEFSLDETGGFDVGLVVIDDLELTYWNEFMTAEMNGERLGTFPDLLMTFDTETGMPVVSAEVKKGQDLAVLSVPKSELKLSSTMFNEELLQAIEPIINKKVI